MRYKKQIDLICSIIALFCFISMYMPIIAPQYPAADYYAPTGSFESESFCTGDYYIAREYWSISRFVFADKSIVLRVVLSLSGALLIYWAFYSVRGEAGKMGLISAVLNLVVTGYVVARMLGVMGYCRWGVLAVLALTTVAAVVIAALNPSTGGAKPAKEKEQN